ncbi:MAG: potassium transporter TrkG, partial [Oscillospiraceae bacterium]
MNIKRSNIEVSPPARIISVSFAMVILIGTILLSLPIATKSGDATPIIDALFTATSATCVTGLIIYDTFTHWSMFGQCVILALIQVGGLGLVTLATFFNLIVGKKIGIRNMQLAKESVSTNSVADVNKMVRIVMGFSFSAELVGALVLATTFVPQYGAYGIFMSIFMSVSAFCNAGFDVCGMQGEFVSLTNYTDNYVVIATISLLIVVGGLGFIVWNNLMEYRKNKRLVLHTKIVLIITGVLITFGTIVFIVFEWNNATTMGGL